MVLHGWAKSKGTFWGGQSLRSGPKWNVPEDTYYPSGSSCAFDDQRLPEKGSATTDCAWASRCV